MNKLNNIIGMAGAAIVIIASWAGCDNPKKPDVHPTSGRFTVEKHYWHDPEAPTDRHLYLIKDWKTGKEYLGSINGTIVPLNNP